MSDRLKIFDKIKPNEHVIHSIEQTEYKELLKDPVHLREVLRNKCMDSLWFFNRHCMQFRDIDTPLHKDMCDKWQARINHKYTLWMIPRSHLKTSLWSEGATLWEYIVNFLRHKIDLNFLIINAKLSNAKGILANIRTYIETKDIFRWLFPEFCYDLATPAQRKRCTYGVERVDFPLSKWAGGKDGNIEIMGVEASLVSRHFTRLNLDDPVNDENTTTKDYRDKIDLWYKNCQQLKSDASKDIIRLIGTRWHFDDLYSRIIDSERKRREQYKYKNQKAIPKYLIYHRQVLEHPVNTEGYDIAGYRNVVPIWPERYDIHSIEDIKEEIGSYVFSCQYMNDPVSPEDAIFKKTDIREFEYFDLPEELVNFCAVDMADEETTKGDMTVITVCSFDSLGKMYVREIIRDKLLPSDILKYIFDMVKKWQIKKIGVETTGFQKMLFKVYKTWAAEKGVNIPWVEVTRGKTAKMKRILSLQPRVERGDFYVDKNMRNLSYLYDEMLTFPNPIFDDILDTLADCEALYFNAPSAIKEVAKEVTYDSYYGSLFADFSVGEYTTGVVFDD